MKRYAIINRKGHVYTYSYSSYRSNWEASSVNMFGQRSGSNNCETVKPAVWKTWAAASNNQSKVGTHEWCEVIEIGPTDNQICQAFRDRGWSVFSVMAKIATGEMGKDDAQNIINEVVAYAWGC